ncbi:hypothetical protein TIFTF001_038814 [Ficus carica]|uniref:Uncharacterized protein n=1 Tax=Ficus carica TaxID=3494 RepID=A0AA88DX12_FICCA|nr:hypothetical protein TIFTF001_032633 [Ficus carica]GMN69769.1 hypothetical protein TIFTF001_038814 [Ficus carica]
MGQQYSYTNGFLISKGANTTTKVGLHGGDYTTVSQNRRANGGLHDGRAKTVV